MILFRVDSSFQMGTGHIYRCLHLAQKIKTLSSSLRIVFLCANLPGNIHEKISTAGFELLLLGPSDRDFDKVNELKPSWLIIDHYGIGLEWERKIHASIKKFVIDDLVREHLCDVILDQNYWQGLDPYTGKVPRHCIRYVGPQYSLLSAAIKAKFYEKPKDAFKVVVFFGGADSRNDLFKFYQGLSGASELLQAAIQVKLVALKSHSNIHQIQGLSSSQSIDVMIEPANWLELLSQSHFYIGSGGTVTWERMCIGTPGAVISVAENQEAISRNLAHDGYQYYWGDSQLFDFSQLTHRLNEFYLQNLSDHWKQLSEMSARGQKLVQPLSKKDLELIIGN